MTCAHFARVVGGEFPISEEEFRQWTSACDPAAACAIEAKFGADRSAAVWLPFGRNAIGLALDLCGVDSQTTIALTAYQCPAAARKIDSRTHRRRFYATDEALNPVPDDFLKQARGAQAVFTTVYFGAPAIERHLSELAEELRGRGESPWIIEDRVMCSPAPLCPDAARRCDFAILSFHKQYPVPDGALLVACSDRARTVLNRFDRTSRIRPATASEHAHLTKKVSAKRKRAAWIASLPNVDDAELNGLRESAESEAALDQWRDTAEADYVAGSRGSALIIQSRDVQADLGALQRKGEFLLSLLKGRQWSSVSVPLVPGAGIGVPIWSNRRDEIRAAAGDSGVFLPVHWPEHEFFPLADNDLKWLQNEITLPTHLHISDADTRHMVDAISVADSICTRT